MSEKGTPIFSDDPEAEARRFLWGGLRTIGIAILGLVSLSLASRLNFNEQDWQSVIQTCSCVYVPIVGVSGFMALLHGFAAQEGRTLGRRED